MRGWVAISVTAMPAAAPRSIREVLRIIIREPSGLRLRPTMGLGRRVSRPYGTPRRVRGGLHRPLWQRPIGLRRPALRRARPLPRTAPSSTDNMEQAEQSEHLSHWQRYLANDAQSEWAAREMQVRLDFIPRAGSLRLSAGTSRYRSLRLGRGHVDDFIHIASARPGRHSLFRNQRLYSDSAGP